MHEQLDCLPVFILSIAADSDGTKKVIHRFRRAARVDAIYVGFGNAYAAVDTDYQTINFKNGSTTVASITNGPASTGSAFTAGVPVICTTMTGAAFAAGDVLTMECTKAGSGLIMADCTVDVRGYYTD